MQPVFAEIITIGEELLIGRTIDTNSAWIGQQLNLIGIKVIRITSVPDTSKGINNALKNVYDETSVVLITGGLGPTKDDITKQALCEFFDTDLILNDDILEDVKKIIFPKYGRLNDLNIKQAHVPKKAELIRNPRGTAPVLIFSKKETLFLSMPGVPHEMEYLMTNFVIPRLKTEFKTPHIHHKNILISGIGESFLSEKLNDWEKQLPEKIQLAYLPSPGSIKIRLTGAGEKQDEIQDEIQGQVNKLEKIIPEYIFGYDEDTIESVIGKLLSRNNLTISTAESCTGGYISHLITSVSGSSSYFKGSLVAYDNEVKTVKLSVKADDIEKYGAVSQQVVEQMAKGALDLFKTDYAIAVTGIAGPGGGTDEKPVGTVWIAVANKKLVMSKQYNFGDDRLRNIKRTAAIALNMLRRFVLNNL